MEKSLSARVKAVSMLHPPISVGSCAWSHAIAERLGRGVGASNALKGLADAVVRKLESLARDIGRRDAGNVLGLCTGNPLDEVEAELRGVRDAVSVNDHVNDVERRELLPEVRGELLFAGFRVAKEGADGLEAVHSPRGIALLVVGTGGALLLLTRDTTGSQRGARWTPTSTGGLISV